MPTIARSRAARQVAIAAAIQTSAVTASSSVEAH